MHVLYLSHTGMTEPLGQSQVLPYLRGLAARGHTFDLVSFEPPDTEVQALETLTRLLEPLGIHHVPLRRSPSHGLGTKVGEAGLALLRSVVVLGRRRPSIVHARSTLPSAVAAVLATTIPAARMLFDCRGLLAEEYVDAGYWQRGSGRYLLTDRVEAALLRRADGVVVLTERLRDKLTEERRVGDRTQLAVIPCCVDAARYRRDLVARQETRQRLGAGDRLVVVYSGTLGSWYCEEEMAQLFCAIRKRRDAIFLVLTRSPVERLQRALAAQGVEPSALQIQAVAPAEMPSWLAGADVGLSLIMASPSKIASSPTKVAEYLAAGLRVVMNRGVGDADRILDEEPMIVDAGDLSAAALEQAAERAASSAAYDLEASYDLAVRRFDLNAVGVARYAALYESLS